MTRRSAPTRFLTRNPDTGLTRGGTTLTGLNEVNGVTYFFDMKATKMGTGWILDGDTWCYADTSGTLQRGWQYVGGS